MLRSRGVKTGVRHGAGPGGNAARLNRTRGWNRNFNHTLKAIFKGAATTVIGRAEDEPIYWH